MLLLFFWISGAPCFSQANTATNVRAVLPCFCSCQGKDKSFKAHNALSSPHPKSQCFSTRHRRIGSSSVFSGGCSRVRIYRVFWKLWLQIAVEWLMIGVTVKFCCHVRRYMQVCHVMLHSAL